MAVPSPSLAGPETSTFQQVATNTWDTAGH